MKKRRSFILLYAVFFASIALVLASLIAAMVSSRADVSKQEYLRHRSEWAAEAGIEWAKARLVSAPGWFTDPPGPAPEDLVWLASAAGQRMALSGASIKVVRAEGSGSVYSVGFTGASIDDCTSVSVIRVRFENPPFRQVGWDRI